VLPGTVARLYSVPETRLRMAKSTKALRIAGIYERARQDSNLRPED
jgi:hypothetical protein